MPSPFVPQNEREEQIARQIHQPSISAVGSGVQIDERSEDEKLASTVKVGEKCFYCGDTLSLTYREWKEHKAACEVEWNKKLEQRAEGLLLSREEEKIRSEATPIDQIPEEDPIPYSGELKRIWGRNKMLLKLIPPADIRKGGIVFPSNVRSVDRDFSEVLLASNIGRVISISNNFSKDPLTGDLHYPELKEWYDKLENGEAGPRVEYMQGAGKPLRGPDNSVCLLIDAQHIYGEF